MTARAMSRDPVALVVDGHSAVRRALCERIQTSFSVQLRQAASVEDALFILDEEMVDIVLIDGQSRGMNGLKGTRALLDRSPQSSVIVMSAFSEASCRSAASRAGAVAFVSKRAINSELIPVLTKLIVEYRQERADEEGF